MVGSRASRLHRSPSGADPTTSSFAGIVEQLFYIVPGGAGNPTDARAGRTVPVRGGPHVDTVFGPRASRLHRSPSRADPTPSSIAEIIEHLFYLFPRGPGNLTGPVGSHRASARLEPPGGEQEWAYSPYSLPFRTPLRSARVWFAQASTQPDMVTAAADRGPTVNRYTVALRQRTTARPLDAARIAVVPGSQGSHHVTVKGRCAIGPGYPSDPIQDELGKCLTAEWCAVEYAGGMRVRDHTGAELDTTLSVEIQRDGNPGIALESRRGRSGQGAGRNIDYKRRLRFILERLAVAGLTINAVLLDTTVTRRMGLSEDERRIPILPNTWPITPAAGSCWWTLQPL